MKHIHTFESFLNEAEGRDPKLVKGADITIEMDDEDGDFAAGDYKVTGLTRGSVILDGMGKRNLQVTFGSLNNAGYTVNESSLLEARKERITIDASLWNGKQPEIQKDAHGDQYIFYSGDVLGGKYLNLHLMPKPNVALIVIETSNGKDPLYIKVGCGSEDEKGIKQYRRSIGDAVQVTAEELKSDPAGYAKKIADIFVASQRYFDMNFMPYDKDAIFRISKDVEKPALELIEYTIKNFK